MTAALFLPALLDRVPDRPVMLVGAASLGGLAIAGAVALAVLGLPHWLGFLGLWAGLGVFYSCVMTPSGRLLRRSAHSEDRPAVFAAQFALSHACWLLTYPLAGWVGQAFGMDAALGLLGAIALAGLGLARLFWPAETTAELEHEHPDLPPDHPHLRAHHGHRRHAHVFVIDDEHRVWPTQG
jgi:MFS family permease